MGPPPPIHSGRGRERDLIKDTHLPGEEWGRPLKCFGSTCHEACRGVCSLATCGCQLFSLDPSCLSAPSLPALSASDWDQALLCHTAWHTGGCFHFSDQIIVPGHRKQQIWLNEDSQQVLLTYIPCSKSTTNHWFHSLERDHGHSETPGSWWMPQSPHSLHPGPHLNPSPRGSWSTCPDCTDPPLGASHSCLVLESSETVCGLGEKQQWCQTVFGLPKPPSLVTHLPLSFLALTRGPVVGGAGFSTLRGGSTLSPSGGLSAFRGIQGVISPRGGNLWVNLCKPYDKVCLTDCRVIFKEDCLLEIFRMCRQKQRLCWTPKTLWHDNTWKVLNSQLFSLRAICSAFLIIPCLPGTSPALSQAICKLNIFWLISIFFLWATRHILSSEYYWLL